MPTGPSTLTSPYILAVEPNVTFTSIATVGDTLDTKPDGVTPYRMVGIPDGLGAYDNGDGTITLLMNHEIVGDTYNLSGNLTQAGDGIVREHGENGAFVSRWVIDKATLAVVSVEDAIKQVRLWDRHNTDGDGDTNVDWLAASPFSISRLCSADLAPVSAYQWIDDQGTADTSDDTVYGTEDRIFLTGEEFSPVRDNPATLLVNEEILGGRQFAVVATGADAGTAFELAHFGYFAWENAISSPYAQQKTINVNTDDGLNGQVYVYVGEKQTTGNAVEKAGLTNGVMYGIRALNLASNSNNENDANAASGRFELVLEDGPNSPGGDISLLTGIELDDLSESKGVTSFNRPEDGQFDPTNPDVFWFVTTASPTGQSRLYKLTFDDITQPELGGTIEAVLDSNQLPVNGTVGPRMMDNITVTATGKVMIQEDIGNNAHLGRVFEYDPATDTLVELGVHDAARFLTGGADFKTQDEESSGIIDVTSMLGDADTEAYLLDVQAHKNLRVTDPELVEDGQLLLMKVETPVLEGTSGDDDLFGSFEDETLNGYQGNDSLRAGSGDDILNGDQGKDILDAGAGDDELNGDNGKDELHGGAGEDTLNGGRGKDVHTGGADADIFVVGRGNGNDVVTDFEVGIDLIELLDGVSLNKSKVADANGDGVEDLVFAFKGGGGSLTLLGVDEFSDDMFVA